MKAKLDSAYLFLKRFRYEIIAVFFTAYGMYLRLARLATRELWCDELASLHTLMGPFKPFWQRFNYTDFTYFPGEYIINWPFVFLFKTNKWGIAIPHLLFTLLGFYLLYLICKRYFHSIFAWIATFALVAFHRELIFHSLELRPYAVFPVLALISFYFSQEIVSKRYTLTLSRKILITFSFIFVVIFHVYGAIVLFFTVLYFLLRESGERDFQDIFKHTYKFLSVLAIICISLFLWYAIGSTKCYKDTGYPGITFLYIPNPILDFYGFMKSNLCNLIGQKLLYPLAIFLVFPFVLPYRERLEQIGFLLLLIVLPIMLIFYSNILIGYHILQRQFVWAMPLFAILIGWCLDSFIGFIRRGKT